MFLKSCKQTEGLGKILIPRIESSETQKEDDDDYETRSAKAAQKCDETIAKQRRPISPPASSSSSKTIMNSSLLSTTAIKTTKNKELTSNETDYNESSTSASTNSAITLNEAFFSDKSNALNPKLNPLIKKQSTVDKIITYTDDTDKLPIDKAATGSGESSKASFTLPLLTASNTSPISRDGFVTNQRYQTLKDNKRNEAQVTNCYDEVYEADDQNGDEEEENESTDLDSKSLSSSTSSTSDSESTECVTAKKSPPKENGANQPVVINMMSSSCGEADEDFDDTDDYGEKYGEKMKNAEDADVEMSTAVSKHKFESLLKQKESEGKFSYLSESFVYINGLIF